MKRGGDAREPDLADDSVVRVAREDADGDDTNAQLRAMRAVWLSMREEDPPDGGLVDLLAAARTKAATMRAGPTLWQRVLAVLRRPPALAFATVVVLVGGAVLFLGRGKGMRAEMAAGPSGSIQSTVAAKEMSVRLAPSARVEQADRIEQAVRVEPAERVEQAVRVEPSVRAERAVGAATVHEDLGAMKGAAPETATADAGAPPAVVEVEVSPGKRAGMQRAPAKPKQAQLEKLYRQCESAARRGDCATVRQVVSRIAKTDRDFRARVVKQAAVAKCLADAVE